MSESWGAPALLSKEKDDVTSASKIDLRTGQLI